MKYEIRRTNKFTKQYAKLLKQNHFKEDNFIKVLNILANGELLPEKYNNHLLMPKTNRYMGMPCSARCTIGV